MKDLFRQDICLGILKGGQLGRMLLAPCMDLGIVPYIMDLDPEAPARKYCQNFTVGDALSKDDMIEFGKDLDILTLEFEHVSLDGLQALRDQGVKIYPAPDLIEIVQDKGLQKEFYSKHGIPTAEYSCVETKEELRKIFKGLPLVQKTRTAGYDGKGVMVIRSSDDLDRAFDAPSVVEEKVDIAKEISVMIARNPSGMIRIYPVVEMVFHHDANMLDYLLSPADLDERHSSVVQDIARKLAEKLELVGVLAVEMFISTDDKVYVNEIAPRPHNSGHHTIESNSTSQFEQHIRAVCDLPLGPTHVHSPAVMINIVGAEGHDGPVAYSGISGILEMPGVHLHLYGKKITRPYRKMGHVTIIRENIEEAIEIASTIKREVKAISCQSSV